jgi:exopolyphosphatase/guanosine-5'-triphosphate,3'-diphosphate pyrophosphatase
MTGRVAAVDIGTNSVRLLVAEAGGPAGVVPSLVTVERLMRITRLGHAVDASGHLDAAAIDRTVAVLREYREVIDRLCGTDAPPRIRMTATSAARDAANREAFFDAAEAVIGVRPELLSGAEEGQLSFLGATADLDPTRGPFLVVDIGGGSTEFSYGTSACEASLSTDMGCVRFSEKYLEHDPPRPEELLAALSVTEAFVDDARQAIPQISEARTFVGLAGTVSAAASVEIGLATYDRDRIHHLELSRAQVEDVFRTLATETRAERLDNPGLEAERADVIVGGMCIFVMIMRRLALDTCLVSEADILDGLALTLLDASSDPAAS